MTALTTGLLELQESRTQKRRALLLECDAADAKAQQAKARLTMLKAMGGHATYPQTATNLYAEWEYWTVQARRLHGEACAVVVPL